MPWPLDATRSADRFARLQASLAQRYRLEREIGRVGPMVAYQARDLTSNRSVALKVIDPARTAAAGTARLLRELRTARRAEHPNLLSWLDAGVVSTEDGDAVYYTVPFLAGESLRARLDREVRLPLADALAIAEDVAAALGAAHAAGMAHGSLAPTSIVLAGGRALLADLGVAAGLEGEPPDPRGDIHGLGQVLYEMLSGGPPVEEHPPPLRAGRAGIPEEVELTVAQLLAPPADRYRTADEALEAVRNAAGAARASTLPGTTTAERAALRRGVPARWSVFSLAVLGLLGLSLWLRYSAPRPVAPPPPPARPGSIAVLPFANATPDSANRYLSDGFATELTAAFGGLGGLRVADPASAFRLGRGPVDPRRVGERLGVDAVLVGSVRPFDDRLRVRAQLVSVREGFDLWSETYDREVSDFTAVQREIVGAVAGVLRLPVPSGPAAAPPAAREAQAAYLRALHVAQGRDTGAVVPLLEESIRLDSAFAPAWAALARAWLRAGARDSVRPPEVARRVREAAERAIALDSSLAEAHAVLGAVQFLHEWDWSGAETSLRRSLALNPNRAEPHLRLAHLLLVVGRVDQAVEAGRRALELSPFDPTVRLHLARQALHVGDYVRAQEDVRHALDLDPAVEGADLLGGLIAAATGRYADAVAPLELAAADTARGDEALATLGWVYALAGQRAQAREIRVRLQEAADTRYLS
ncbi:MAG TPA: hypothetical protein VFZ26_06470, partial [Gemmatimonadales bacterium]